MPDSILIRPALISDAEAIAALSEQLGYPADAIAMEDRLRRILSQPEQLMLIAQQGADGTACGWLQALASEVIESGFRVEIVGLIVDARHRRQGIGQKLVAAAEGWARDLGAGSVTVRSNIARSESHAFYPAQGYAAIKTQTVYRKKFIPSEAV